MKEYIDQNVNEIKDKLVAVFDDLNLMIAEINNEELAKTAQDISSSISEPFMFVIVGEVKAGKSSFINALLESAIVITSTPGLISFSPTPLAAMPGV